MVKVGSLHLRYLPMNFCKLMSRMFYFDPGYSFIFLIAGAARLNHCPVVINNCQPDYYRYVNYVICGFPREMSSLRKMLGIQEQTKVEGWG